MKKTFFFHLLLLISILGNAQSPQGFNYQAVLRDGSGNILSDAPVIIKFSIKEDSTEGTTVYSEAHSETTNRFGLINLVVGKGTSSLGDFSNIAWGAKSHFLEVNLNGVSIGTTELLSVPYALSAASVAPREHLITIPAQSFIPNNNGASYYTSIGQGGTELESPGAGVVNRLTAPLILPHGAKIVEITAYYKNNSDAEFSIDLTRENLAGGVFEASIPLVTSAAASNTWQSASKPLNIIVNNNIFGYSLSVNSSDWKAAGEKSVKGIKVKYIY